jgi:hypothetical protein
MTAFSQLKQADRKIVDFEPEAQRPRAILRVLSTYS